MNNAAKSWFFWFGVPAVVAIFIILTRPMFNINREPPPELLTNALLSNLKFATKMYIEDCHQQPSMENKVFYKQITGDNPRKIEYMEFTKRDVNINGEIIDAWQTPVKIAFDQNHSIIFISAGKDKKIGTKDDINSDPLPTSF